MTTTVAGHTVNLRASGLTFSCADGRTVLEAAEDAGLRIPYSCRKGVCSTCEGRLVRGEVDLRGRTVTGPVGGVRFCQARPRGDVDVVPTRVERRGPPQRKRLPARLFAREDLAPGVTSLRLRLPIGRRAPFSAGQYLRVHLDGDSRNYSLANAPQDNDRAELHIRHVDGGRFSGEVLRKLAVDDVLDIEVPFGEFGVDDDSDRPVVLVATGTGFAPMRSIVLDHIRRRRERPIRLYWGARSPDDLYLLEAARGWAGRFPWFEVVPVVSGRSRDWAGRTGPVHEAVLEDLPDLSGRDVLTCGNPAMTAAARDTFSSRGGLPPDQYVADAFLPSGDHNAEA